jgi:carboxyl-terminal processing protease
LSKFKYYINKFLGRRDSEAEIEKEVDQLILEETDVNNQLVTSKSERKLRTKKENKLPGTEEKSTVTVSRNLLLIWGIIIVIVSVAVTFFAADRLYFGGYFVDTSNKVTFDTESNDLYNIAKLQTIIDEIENSFYPGVDKNVLVEGAISGIVEALNDRFTVYYKPGTMTAYKEFITGSYEGIGVQVKTCDKGLEVTEVYEGNPAANAGIAVGDILVQINGESTVGMDSDRLAQLLGTGDTKLKLDILTADGKEKTAELTVDKVQVQTVYTQPEGEGVYRVTVSQFDSDTGTEFYDKVTEIINKGCRALIIDLRNNGGGYESQAVKIADMLLPEGIIASSKDKNGKVIKEIKSEASSLDMPIVLLVNGNTASASELLAGAVKDFAKGKLVGTKTHGKAIGQIQMDFEQDGSGLVITTSCYYTPSGKCIQGTGIMPDFHVELPEEYRQSAVKDIPEDKDTQLQKAMELITAELD